MKKQRRQLGTNKMKIKTVLLSREDILKEIASAYFKLLTSLDWSDDVLISGLREGLTKFLSNAFIHISKNNKYEIADYYSTKAVTILKSKSKRDLVFEHMVPKQQYIQKPCEQMAKEQTLTFELVVEKLIKYWHTAVITKNEDALLRRQSMPYDWNESDIFLRYKEAKIKLKQNVVFGLNHRFHNTSYRK